jgi:hypothetical protein
MKDKVYFPKDDKLNLFSVASAKEGIIIPLIYWGYPQRHVTLYVKDMNTKPGYQKVNIHLTNENNNKRILELNYEFPKDALNPNNQKFIEELRRIFQESFNKFYTNENKRFVCIECFLKDKFIPGCTEDQEKARQFYNDLIKNSKNLKKEDFDINKECTENKHCLFYDLKEEALYIRYLQGFVTYSDNDLFLKKVEALFKEQFSPLANGINTVFKSIKKALRKDMNRHP